MKRWHKIVLVMMAVLIGLGAVGYLNRASLLLTYVRYQMDRVPVAENRSIEWQQGPAEADAPIAQRPPNIVFILLDDLGINDLSTFGGGVAEGSVPTPNIDKLAADGAIFNQAYAGHATCAPSRAMLMTGRYSTRTGFEFTPTPAGMASMVKMVGESIRTDHPPIFYDEALDDTKPPYQDQGLPSSEVTIAETLQEKGYHTVHIGKWHLGTSAGFMANDQGFDESLLMASGMFLPEDDPGVINANVDFDPIDHFLWASMTYAASFNGSERFRPGGYLTDWWTDESLKVIEANRNRPFFLYLAHWAPHTPLQATRADYDALSHIKEHRLRVYAAMIRALDRSVGRIMQKLEEEGLADNTMIVLSSDNGGAGYIGLPEVNAPYRGWKITQFEGGIRVPLLIKWPGQIAPGTQIDTPVAHIDMMPTLASAAGANLPEGVSIDGLNILPLARGTGSIERLNNALFWQSGHAKVVRAGDWKLQVNGRLEKNWLFDLAKDPTEQVNLAEKNPEKLAELQALLDAHHKDRKPPLYPSVSDMPIMVDKTLAETFEAGDEYVYAPN